MQKVKVRKSLNGLDSKSNLIMGDIDDPKILQIFNDRLS